MTGVSSVTWEMLALVMFLGASGGIIVPMAALMKHRQLNLRIARQPAATALENVEQLLIERRREMAEIQENLTDLAQQLVRRDMAVAEAEEARIKLVSMQESLTLLEPKRIELEKIEQTLASQQEAMADLYHRLMEGEAKHEEQERTLRRIQDQLTETENQLKEFEERRQQIEQLLEILSKRQREQESTLQEKNFEIHAAKTALAEQREKLTEGEETLKRQRQEADDLKVRRDALNAEVVMLEQRKAQTEAALVEQSERLDKGKESLRRQFQEAEELHRKREVLNNEIALLDQRKVLAESALAEQKEKLSEGEEALKRQRQEADDLRAKRDALNAEVVMLEQRKAELERMKATLQGYIEQAHKERDEEVANALADLKRAPACLSEAGLKAARNKTSEDDALQDLRIYLDKLGLHFPQRTLNAFHTCMKINGLSPLTVLAGISGTGKSELPRRYAEGMGIHFLQMAVQPRWDSPQDLFGFYNYLEHRYIGTDLARALIHLDDRNHPELAKDWREHMLLVLLDEMNLARVEYYFSEFLSRLEVRKSVDPANPASRQDAEIQLDVGGRERVFNLYVDRNVLFVGTMNEDESTQTLSDKVIDRANVLRFGRPKKLVHSQPVDNIPRPDRYLPRSMWEQWICDTDQLGQQNLEKLHGWIKQLNDAMEGLERPFGHRVNQAIQLYCANYPGESHYSLANAFADQLEQRILPKLRGIDTVEFSIPLGQIQDLIVSIGDNALAEAVQTGRQKPLFGWQGLNRSD